MEDSMVFVYPVIAFGLVALKMYSSFKVGRKYEANEMMRVAQEELAGMEGVSKEFAEKIILRIAAEAKDRQMTTDDFLMALKGAFADMKDGVKSCLDNTMDGAKGMTAKACKNFAGLFQKAANNLSAEAAQ